MDFNLKSPLVTRVGILAITIFFFCYILLRESTNWFMVLLTGAAVVFQVRQL